MKTLLQQCEDLLPDNKLFNGDDEDEYEEKFCPNCKLKFLGIGIDSICPECGTKFINSPTVIGGKE